LRDLKKVSLNKWYSGIHWSERKRIKDNYYLTIKSQFKHVFKKSNKYEVDYQFYFKSNPLDASNACGGMVKLIEDIIFEDDKWDIIIKITVSSQKSKEEYLKIIVTEL